MHEKFAHMKELGLSKHFTQAGKEEKLGAPFSSLMTIN